MSATFGQLLSTQIEKYCPDSRKRYSQMIRGFLLKRMVPLSSYKGTWKFLKAVLLPMYGSAYPSHFRNFRRCDMKQSITSKVIGKIIDNAFCLLYSK